MNASKAARIADAIILERNSRALERAGAQGYDTGSYDQRNREAVAVRRESLAGDHIRPGGSGVVEVWGRGGSLIVDPEGEAMKQRLIKHMLIAVAIVTVFLAFHVFSRM